VITLRAVHRGVVILMAASTLVFGAGAVASAAPAASTPVSIAPAMVPTPQHPVAWDDQTGAPLVAWECPSGRVCFWNNFDGAGSRCYWNADDPNWLSGSIRCSWADTYNVRSVSNRKTVRVEYFTSTNYRNRIGSTTGLGRGNLAGTYELRSHRWVNS
jgi:hypothetical protein